MGRKPFSFRRVLLEVPSEVVFLLFERSPSQLSKMLSLNPRSSQQLDTAIEVLELSKLVYYAFDGIASHNSAAWT